jgi:hypothetical protein
MPMAGMLFDNIWLGGSGLIQVRLQPDKYAVYVTDWRRQDSEIS